MSPEAGIPRHPESAPPLGFEALRAEGLAWIQALSGEVWTDYHAHDPGVTMLEVFCYALTEGVYAAEFPVSQLLGGPEGRLDLARHGLHTGLESLPTRPVTREDYQRWLLDQVPALTQLSMAMPPPSNGRPAGLWRMGVQVSARGGQDPGPPLQAAVRAYHSQRNLCEDLDGPPEPLRLRPCRLTVALTVAGGRDLVDLLTDLFQRCASLVAREPRRMSFLTHLEEGLARGLSQAELLEGPPNRHGWVDAAETGAKLYFSDLTRELETLEGIETIHHLGLEAPGVEARGGGLPSRGPGWALQLEYPQVPADLSGLTVLREGAPVSLPVDGLLRNLKLRATGPRAVNLEPGPLESWAASPLALPAPRGLPDFPFRPAQLELPPLHQGGTLSLGMDEGPGNPAVTAGLRGYLALFEQWLAHAHAQRQQLRELFTLEPGPAGSYAWQMLGEAQLPGLEALFRDGWDGARIRKEAFEVFDDVLERRGRVLDFLLGLHGVSFNLKPVRAFGWYFTPKAWERHLYEQKRQLLEAIVPLTRDRAGGIDLGRPSLDAPDNTAVLQQLVSLQLGFKQRLSRSLAAGGMAYGLKLGTPEDRAPARLAWPLQVQPSWRAVLDPNRDDPISGSPVPTAELLRALPRTPLHPAFWRCAVHAGRFWLAPDPSGLWALLLGPDEQDQWWHLRTLHEPPFESGPVPAEAAGLAYALWGMACRTQLDGEGMHLVEHVLLRPSTPEPAPAPEEVPAAFYPHRLTAVVPAWTARGAHPAFRALAQATLAEHLPAHLQADCLWLDLPDLMAFEGLYEDWLDAKLRQTAYAGVALAQDAVDGPARELRRWLWAHRPDGAS